MDLDENMEMGGTINITLQSVNRIVSEEMKLPTPLIISFNSL